MFKESRFYPAMPWLQVPLKFCYPFYGAIHWYVLQQYSQQLNSIGVVAHTEHEVEDGQQGEEDKEEEEEEKGGGNERVIEGVEVSPSSSSGSSSRWLKCVSVSRLSSPGSQPVTEEGESGDQENVKSASQVRQLCLPLSIPLKDMQQMDRLLTEPQVSRTSLDESSPLRGGSTPLGLLDDAGIRKQCQSKTLCTGDPMGPMCAKPPYLSRFEREGLLMLIHRIKDDHLFEMDACVPQPSCLLDDLKSQLGSPMLYIVSGHEPSGIGLLSPTLFLGKDLRKRSGQGQSGEAQKRRKRNGSTVNPPPELKLGDRPQSKATSTLSTGLPPSSSAVKTEEPHSHACSKDEL